MTGRDGMGELGHAAAAASLAMTTANGSRNRMHRLILDAIKRHGPMTAGETFRRLEKELGTRLWDNTRTRFGELRAKGWLVEAGQKRCTTSGRPAIVWALGDGKPPARPPVVCCEACGRPLPRRRFRKQ